MNLIDHLESRLSTCPDYYWDRHNNLKKFQILINRLKDILKKSYEDFGSSYLEDLGCEVRLNPSPGFSDYGERARRENPDCEIESITLYFVANWFEGKWNPRSIQVIVPVGMAEKLLILS